MRAGEGMLTGPLLDSPVGDGLPGARLVRVVLALLGIGVALGIVLLLWTPALPNEQERTSAAPPPASRPAGQSAGTGTEAVTPAGNGAGQQVVPVGSGAAPTSQAQPAGAATTAPAATTTQGQRYTIRPGDTLLAIADRFDTTPDAIRAANPGLNETALQIGAEITIPPSR
jgi:hypothetical protein